jgi:hypothetical protein
LPKSIEESDPSDYRLQFILKKSVHKQISLRGTVEMNEIKKCLQQKRFPEANNILIPFLMDIHLPSIRVHLLVELKFILFSFKAQLEKISFTVNGKLKKADSDLIYTFTHCLLGCTRYGLMEQADSNTIYFFIVEILNILFQPWRMILSKPEENSELLLELLWVTLLCIRYAGGTSASTFLPEDFGTMRQQTLMLIRGSKLNPTHWHHYHQLYHQAILSLAVLKELSVQQCTLLLCQVFLLFFSF